MSWIGRQDLLAAEKGEIAAVGLAVEELAPNRLALLNNFPLKEISRFLENLKSSGAGHIDVKQVHLSSPTRHEEIYPAVLEKVNAVKASYPESELFFHLSPGTPAMHAVWMLIAKTQVRATLVETTAEQGFRVVELPFSISMEFYPDSLKQPVRSRLLSAEDLSKDPDMEGIIFRSDKMTQVLNEAIIASEFDVPILVEGETGTGKEVLAGLIHRKSNRKDGPFIPVNCGAIPRDIIESELFGYVKGAFTGATSDKEGYFEAAGGGTLFLDEIGDLPAEAQVKILRILNDGTYNKVGSPIQRKSNTRIIAATHKSLHSLVKEGSFREDLFYRLAVVSLNIPPLRDRRDDLVMLIRSLFGKLRTRFGKEELGLSPEAMDILQFHNFPGNTRELINTLQRLIIFAGGEIISGEEAERALISRSTRGKEANGEVDLDITRNISRLFTDLYNEAGRKASTKKEIAKMMGFDNHQTLDNWVKKYYRPSK